MNARDLLKQHGFTDAQIEQCTLYGKPIPPSDSMAKVLRNKYKNVPVVVDGIRFDSKAEARRWGELKILARCGVICFLVRQPPFELPAGIVYRGDFRYLERESGKWVVEDVKGIFTKDFRLKAKLFQKTYPDWELRIVQ